MRATDDVYFCESLEMGFKNISEENYENYENLIELYFKTSKGQ
jgi:hypothetical protein